MRRKNKKNPRVRNLLKFVLYGQAEEGVFLFEFLFFELVYFDQIFPDVLLFLFDCGFKIGMLDFDIFHLNLQIYHRRLLCLAVVF